MVSEAKFDSFFFFKMAYCPLFRYDRSSHGGVILLYIREDINRTLLKDFKGIFVELKLSKKKICYAVPIACIK